ncbi:MAG: sigma-54 dependent transcriptional regulator [Deferrisomatales bacterium]|nr:sigma-54 dependent transcriptional regulator [Deferrisomatales bacterium]
MLERAKILVIDDELPLRELLRMEFARAGHTVETASGGEEGLTKYREEIFNVVLLDIRMLGLNGVEVLRQMRRESTIPEIIMLTGHGTIESAVDCIKEGAYEYLTKPVKFEELALVVRKAHEKNLLRIENINLKLEVANFDDRHQIVGRSPPFRKALALVERLGPSDEHLLVQGESGTGKEVIARSVHNISHRSNKQFVALNCGRLNAHTAESELFGHMQGAFTGAVKGRAGVFELAHTGTLFLDEVSEMPLDVQVKLLRILESSTFRRLGGNKDILVDVRFVFASNQNLEKCVARGTFREDLFHRINLLTIDLPPLRERGSDISLLAEYFLQTDPRRGNRRAWEITPETQAILLGHSWPGNVRELKNTLRRACILATEPLITPDLLPFQVSRERSPTLPGCPRTRPNPLWMVERDHICQMLALTGGNKSRAAHLLGIDRKTLYAKIERYDHGKA